MNALGKISSALVLSFVGLVSLGAAGCGGSDVTPSVSGSSPLSAFRGRTSDVLLSGSGTHWDSTAVVSFGEGITVNKVTAASPTALVVNITVAGTAALGPRDITVTQGSDASSYTMAFSIESPVEVHFQGATAQGSIVFLTIENKDLEHLFDDTSEGGGLFSAPTFPNVAIKGPIGTTVNVSNVTPFRVDATMLIDATAPAVAFDLDLASGPKDGPVDNFVYPAVFQIATRTAEAITGPVMANLDKPFESKLYKITPGGADHLFQLDVVGDSSDAKPSIVLLEAPGSFKKIIDNGKSLSFLTDGATDVYVVLYDAGGTGGYNASLTATDTMLTTQAGGEGDDTANNAFATPITVTAPVRVKGASLSSDSDVDWYKITIAGADVGKRIHVQTFPGDTGTDVTLRVYKGADDTMPFTDEVDSGAHDKLTTAVTTAGDYLIKVGASSYFSSSASHYDLVVTLQ